MVCNFEESPRFTAPGVTSRGCGPNPCECIDLVMQCQVCLLGQSRPGGALFDPVLVQNPSVAERLFSGPAPIGNAYGNAAQRQKRWDFLKELSRNFRRRSSSSYMARHGTR